MNTDDIIYLALLFFSIGFGEYYRTLPNAKSKKTVGLIVGLTIILIVSGFHILHVLISSSINALIILYLDKRKCHIVSFVFSFLYLFFFRTTIYFGIPYPPAHTNLVQMMLTLKLVGLAMEVNSSYTSRKKKDSGDKSIDEKLEDESNEFDLTFMDVFYYAFNYVGVLTGPYYRYRTFNDFLNKPYSNYIDYKAVTLDKLKYTPLFAAVFLWGSYNWPLSYAMSEEFYTDRSWLYRYWYIWPTFTIFRMRIYIGLVLSECACTMAGIGVYPTFTKPLAGNGPSENYEQLRALTREEDLKATSYNYETIHNINPYGAEFCTTYREGMKHWNICIQYWLAVNVYKRFPNKKFRTIATLLVSSAWHGIYTGYYVCIATVPFELAFEDVWVKILLKNKTASKPVEWLVWFFRTQMFSYQGIAFHLLQVNIIWRYYNSIFHFCLILYFILYLVGLYILKMQRIASKASKSTEEKWEQEQSETKKLN